jgi:hypothetical protein
MRTAPMQSHAPFARTGLVGRGSFIFEDLKGDGGLVGGMSKGVVGVVIVCSSKL